MRPFVAEAANAYGLPFEEQFVGAIEQVAPAIDAIAASPGAGLVLPSNNWVHNNASYFVDAINFHRLPAVYPATRMVEQGGLIGLGVDTTASFYRGGVYAGHVLDGTSPGDLPVLSPRYVLIVNLRTAALLGVTIPVDILATADRVIE